MKKYFISEKEITKEEAATIIKSNNDILEMVMNGIKLMEAMNEIKFVTEIA